MLSPLDQTLAAISQIESGGDYGATGPTVKYKDGTTDNAYGKYQVMGKNVPAWTQIALGKRMTPSQFQSDPDAQEAVARKILGGYVDQYGPRGAAAKWFSGKPDVTNPSSDGYNTVPQYVQKFDRAFSNVGNAGLPQDASAYGGSGGLSPDMLLAAAKAQNNAAPAAPAGSANSVVANDFSTLPPANPDSPAQTPASRVAGAFDAMNGNGPGMTPNQRVAQGFDALGQASAPGAAPPAPRDEELTQVAQNNQTQSDATPVWAKGLNTMAPALERAGAYLTSISNPSGGAALLNAAQENQLARTKMAMPTWGVIGKDPWTGVEQYGWINPLTQTTSAGNAAPGGGTGGGAPSGPGATPTMGNMSPDQVSQLITTMKAKGASTADILGSLPPTVGSTIQGMLTGAESPQYLSRQGQIRNLYIGLAHQLDPNFTETTYGMRQAQAKDLGTEGKLGQNLISANQVVNHAGQLYDDIDALGNSDSPLLNAIKNPFKYQTDPQYQQALAAFSTHKLALSSELVKLMRGTGGAESDIQAWQKQFGEANSPGALKTAVQNALQIMHGRIEAATNQYNTAFGSNYGAEHFLSPNANATINRINGAQQQQQQASAPAAPTKANPVRTKTIGNKTYWFDGQNWHDD